MTHSERVCELNDQPMYDDASYVLYWMQQSQRAYDNPALEYVIQQANDLNKPILVAFGLMGDYPEANARHYSFMLEGLQETQKTLKERGIKMVVQHGHPRDVALELSQNACLVVADRGYLQHLKDWRKTLALEANCKVIEVDADTVVPIHVASPKAEYAARTIRPKIHRRWDEFLEEPKPSTVKTSSLDLDVDGLDLGDIDGLIDQLGIDTSVPAVSQFFKGGSSQALKHLDDFLQSQFDHYSANRNQPQTDSVSYMGMYLQYGQISPVRLALKIKETGAGKDNIDDYLEELIVRRELAMNFTYYTPNYDQYSVVPEWAQKTLSEHKSDQREYIYSLQELEDAQTHDPYWNAAMNEMRYTGYMHNYMRMYWGKKILEWTADPKDAFERTLHLNNKYFLDGMNSNSYTGVAWCYGVHDRAWTERAVFGKIRYMNANGLKRKAKPDAYVKKVDRLVKLAKGEHVEAEGEQLELFS